MSDVYHASSISFFGLFGLSDFLSQPHDLPSFSVFRYATVTMIVSVIFIPVLVIHDIQRLRCQMSIPVGNSFFIEFTNFPYFSPVLMLDFLILICIFSFCLLISFSHRVENKVFTTFITLLIPSAVYFDGCFSFY